MDFWIGHEGDITNTDFTHCWVFISWVTAFRHGFLKEFQTFPPAPEVIISAKHASTTYVNEHDFLRPKKALYCLLLYVLTVISSRLSHLTCRLGNMHRLMIETLKRLWRFLKFCFSKYITKDKILAFGTEPRYYLTILK